MARVHVARWTSPVVREHARSMPELIGAGDTPVNGTAAVFMGTATSTECPVGTCLGV